MEHELIDLLDDNGKVVGTVDKAIAHRDGLWHRSVHVWIINDNSEILLQHRCSEKSFFPNVWDCSFAGHIGAGEGSLETAVREGKEEIGLDIDASELDFVYTNKEKLVYGKTVSNEFVDIYLLKKNIDLSKQALQKEEVDGLKWIKLQQFFEMIEEGDESLLPHDKNEYFALKNKLDSLELDL